MRHRTWTEGKTLREQMRQAEAQGLSRKQIREKFRISPSLLTYYLGKKVKDVSRSTS